MTPRSARARWRQASVLSPCLAQVRVRELLGGGDKGRRTLPVHHGPPSIRVRRRAHCAVDQEREQVPR